MQREREHFLPILIRHGHLLNNFFDVLVGCLNCLIHLGPVRHGIMVLDLEILAHFLHHLVIQIGGIVCDNLPGQSIPADYLLFDEPDYHAPRDTRV